MGQDGEEYLVLTLGQAPATASVRMAAAAIIGTLAVVTLVVATHARAPMLILPGFLPALASLTALADMLTAYLLWGQARAGEEPALVLLAVTYLGSAVLVAANAWLFPAAFFVAGERMGEAAAWLWVFWHVLFAGGVTAYGLYPAAWSRPANFPRVARRSAGIMAILVVAAVTLARSGYLPALVGGARFHLPAFLLGLIPVAMVLAMVALAYGRRARTVLDTWLFVAMAGIWCDAALMHRGAGRFSVGWYAAHAVSLAASLAVLLGCLAEVNRLYGRLVWREARMNHANAHLRAVNSELSTIAERDALTQLLNRRAVLQHLSEHFEAWRLGDAPFGILMIDLDHFKTINDEWGHLAGDEVLAQVAARLRTAVRRSDVVGRYGGEEFLVVLPGTGAQGVRATAAKLLEAVRAMPFGYQDRPIPVTVSIGATCVDDKDADADSTIARADRALYAAKRDGRDRQVWADPDPGADLCA